MNMTTSPAGRKALTEREGVRLHAYKDSVGVWTIGVGHTGRMSGPKVTPKMTITAERADELLKGDLVPTEKAVNAALKRPVTQNQFNACVSLAFNIGTAGFTSSSVVRHINDSDIHAAADAFLLWDKPPELMGRRRQERAQFLTP